MHNAYSLKKKKMLGCFNPILGQISTNPAIGVHFLITFLTQRLGLSVFDPQLVKTTQHFICVLYRARFRHNI